MLLSNFSHKVWSHTGISGSEKSVTTHIKQYRIFHVCWYSQSAADTSLAFGVIENYDHCCFCNHDSTHFSILRVSANALYDCYSGIVDSFIFIHSWSRLFFLVKGYKTKQNNTWLLVDMEFLFSCSTRHLTRSPRSLASYRVKHLKRNSIYKRPCIILYLHTCIVVTKRK